MSDRKTTKILDEHDEPLLYLALQDDILFIRVAEAYPFAAVSIQELCEALIDLGAIELLYEIAPDGGGGNKTN